jgi:hypothetical protein
MASAYASSLLKSATMSSLEKRQTCLSRFSLR